MTLLYGSCALLIMHKPCIHGFICAANQTGSRSLRGRYERDRHPNAQISPRMGVSELRDPYSTTTSIEEMSGPYAEVFHESF